MLKSIDQLGNEITLAEYPQRIISLVPSQTELLYHLQLEEEVKGITKFCIHPDEWFRKKIRVGGTKKLNTGKIQSIRPDLILANKEENTKEDITGLQKTYNVWVSDIRTLDDAFDMIGKVSHLTNREKAGEGLISRIRNEFSRLSPFPKIRAAYLIWKNPFMTVGGDTFISHMLEHAGYQNVFSERKRYPQITTEELAGKKPEVIFLSSEPFPFRQEDAEEMEKTTSVQTLRVEGDLFSWYGSRLLLAPLYFLKLREKIHSPL